MYLEWPKKPKKAVGLWTKNWIHDLQHTNQQCYHKDMTLYRQQKTGPIHSTFKET
jgi:hypothetical protein